MILRYQAICNECSEKFIFRGVVPNARKSSFEFPCPGCKIRLKGKFKLEESPNLKIEDSNFSLESVKGIVPLSTIPMAVVTISTEIPIHKLFHDKDLLNGGSPFLWLAQNMGLGFLEWFQLVQSLNDFNNTNGSLLQKLVNYASVENWKSIQSTLAETLDQAIEKVDDQQVIYLLHKMLASFYAPLINPDEMVKILEEYYVYLNDCLQNHESDYADMLNDFYRKYNFSMFKKQVYEIYYKVIVNFDSFITGIFYERASQKMKDELSNYRLFRDDYSIVKSLYQDIFELNSKSMLYVASVVNLSKRNDPCIFASGINSCDRFRGLSSFKKLEVLNEFVLLKDFMNNVSRLMRNSIAHFSTEYDYVSGNLIFEDGSNQNYIEFLGQFSWAVKSVWFLLTVVEKVELDHHRLNLR